MYIYLAQLVLELEMFQAKVVEKIKTLILYSILLFLKIVLFVKLCGNIL
jgi:hypothetical protein